MYLELKNTEKILLYYIWDVLEDNYVELLVDEYINLLIGNVPTILNYLFCNYRKVRSEEVAQKES